MKVCQANPFCFASRFLKRLSSDFYDKDAINCRVKICQKQELYQSGAQATLRLYQGCRESEPRLDQCCAMVVLSVVPILCQCCAMVLETAVPELYPVISLLHQCITKALLQLYNVVPW